VSLRTLTVRSPVPRPSDNMLKMMAVHSFFGGLILTAYLLPVWPWWLALLAIPLGAIAAYGFYLWSLDAARKE